MKKIFLIGLCLCSLFLFTSCKSSEQAKPLKDYIALSCYLEENRVETNIEFGYDGQRFQKRPTSEVVKFKKRLKENIETLRNEFLLSFAIKFSQNPIDEFAINKGVFLSQVVCEGDNVGFNIIYSSIASWRYYNSSSKEGNLDKGVTFIKKIENCGVFPFAGLMSNGKRLGEKYKQAYSSALKGLTFETIEKREYDPYFIYDYATYSSRLKSDCQIYKHSNGLYHNIWIKSGEKYKNATIKLWQYEINYGSWQLIAILICIIPCGVYIYIQNQKEKQAKLGYKLNK